MILIIGGTGKVGREVVKQLAQKKIPARVLVRSAHAEIEKLGLESVTGDWTNLASVDAALRGVDRVFLLTPPMPDEAARKSAIIDAAKRAHVKYIVLQSGAGASADSEISQARQHARADDYLKDSGLAYTILQPYFFMQNVIGQAAAIASQGAVYGNFGSGRLAMVDARDIAAVAVAALAEGGNHRGQTYVITGRAAITHAEAAQTLSSVLGKTIGYVNLPSQQLVKAIASAGTPEWLARDLALLGEEIAAGHFARITDVVEKITKRPPISFEQFVQDNAEAFDLNASTTPKP
jgi:uncharacterized protein YbjT (DUF2867 family)